MSLSANLETRRTFLARWRRLIAPAFLCGSGGAGVYGYSSTLERHQLSIEKHQLTLGLGERAPAKFRVVSLTDIHFDPLYEEWYLEECVQRVNDLKPDMVFLTGDFVTQTSKRIAELAQIFGKLQVTAGVFACLGNHDYWDSAVRIRGEMERQGVSTLVNDHTRVSVLGGEVIVAGLQSVWGGKPHWGKAATGIKKDDRVLMLMHEPDYADVLCQDERIVLQCSGHTHGGQVRMPGYGAMILPMYGKRYQAGLYNVKKLQLHVNRGIGTVDKHVRFFCPPEIACFDVTNAASVVL